MKVKLSEIVKKYKSLREAGLDKAQAQKALDGFYAKKGYTGNFVLKEDGEEIATADLEFKELEAEMEGGADDDVEGPEEHMKAFTASHARSIETAVTKALDLASKKFIVPAHPVDREEEDRHGFRTLGEFATAVKSLSVGKVDKRFERFSEKSTLSVGQGESSIEAGGALIPPGFLSVIKEYSNLEGPDLLGMSENIPVTGNSLRIPSNEETPWGGGVQAYWQGEMNAANQVKTKFSAIDLRLNDLTCLVNIGNDLLEDSQAASAVVARRIGMAIRWKQNDALVNGSGAGMPQGILNSGSLVTIAKESGQDAQSLVQANLAKMYAAHLNPTGAVWLVNPRVEQVILQLASLPGGLLPGVFNFATGIAGSPYNTLIGRPVIACRNLNSLGNAGDIVLADFKQYLAISKSMQMATSIHLFFDSNTTSFRAVSRIDGKTWATKPVVDAKDANFKQSYFVALGARV